MLPSWLSGSVLLECEGGYPERFLNTAASLNVPLWDVHRRKASLWCRTSAAHYRTLRPAARAARARMRVRAKYGLPFRIKRWGLRGGLFAGAAVFLVLLSTLSSRVWVIQVRGNTTVPSEEILAVLAPLGVREGCRFNNVDLPSLQLTALQQLPSVTWLTVNQSGSILTVEVKERSGEHVLTKETPCNLIAACDGVIVSIHTACGQAVVKAGDAVRRGDLLISGIADSKVGPRLTHAAGSILARTTHTRSVTVPLNETVTVPSHTVERPYLTAFGFKIPLFTAGALAGSPVKSSAMYPLTANGVSLPLGLAVDRFAYTAEQSLTRTAEEALALAEQRLTEAENELLTFLTAESRTVDKSITEQAVTLTVTVVGIQELGIKSQIG